VKEYYVQRGDIYLDALLEARKVVGELTGGQARELQDQVSDLITAAIAKVGELDDRS